MNLKSLLYWSVLMMLLAGGEVASAQSRSSARVPGPADYAAFSRFIASRNIFDPERYPHGTQYRAPVIHRPKGAPVPAFSFVGSMVYGKGMFAFFDGNNPEYRKALQTSGKIAGYTIEAISLNSVKLAAGGKSMVLKVGSQLRQGRDGGWEPAGMNEGYSDQEESSATATATDSSSTAAPSASSGDVSDVLKRLMKLREQENK